MNTRTTLVLGLVVLVILGAVISYAMVRQSSAPAVATSPETTPTPLGPEPTPQPTTRVETSSPAPTPTSKPTPAPVKTPPVQGKPIVTSQSNNITIHDYSFLPATLTVKKGTTVTWTNDDIAKHTVTGDQGGPSSDFFGQGQSYSYTFNTLGTFPYHCEPHPYMTATIVVTE